MPAYSENQVDTSITDEEFREYWEIKTQLDALEKKKKALSARILEKMLEDDHEKLKVDRGVFKASVSLSKGRESRTVNPKKLVAAGVDPDTIEECTDVKQGDPYVVVRVTMNEG